MSGAADNASLAPTAHLLGRLLVRELDAATLAELRQPAVAEALAAVGIMAPVADVEALAAEYFDFVLQPPGSLPLVASLWQHGQYDGDAAVAVRELARAAGLAAGPGARSAPPDQLGSLLSLWAELATTRPDLADRLAHEHLGWVTNSAAPHAPTAHFYGQVLRAAAALAALLAVD